MQYKVWQDEDGEGTVTVLYEGELYSANTDHPSFAEIVAGAVADDPDVIDLFDRAEVIGRHFDALSERVTVGHGHIYFDGNEIDNSLAKHILRTLEDSPEVISYMPFVNFLEKVEINPNEHSREQLYAWCDHHDFTITLDGDIIAYKGVYEDGTSCTSGRATVDGRVVTGHIPNQVGSIIEMPRLSVQHNPNEGCSTGLHVATHGFARSFGDKVLSVLVNPRDVVSVPNDSNCQKMRVCRYRVVEVLDDSPHAGTVVDESEFDEDLDLIDAKAEIPAGYDSRQDWDEDPRVEEEAEREEEQEILEEEEAEREEEQEILEEEEEALEEEFDSGTFVTPNNQSPLDQEPVYDALVSMVGRNAPNSEIINVLDVTYGVVTTKDSLRRFKQRHGIA